MHALAHIYSSEAETSFMRTGLAFSDSALVLQAAADGHGHGVALGRVFLASSDLEAGRLVKPFALDLPNDYSYWLAYPKAAAEQPRLRAFPPAMLQDPAHAKPRGWLAWLRALEK